MPKSPLNLNGLTEIEMNPRNMTSLYDIGINRKEIIRIIENSNFDRYLQYSGIVHK